MNVAQIIINQIKQLDRMALMAWGAKNRVDGNNSVSFKVNGPKFKHGIVKITLDEGRDLYNVEFMKFRSAKKIIDEKIEGVFCDQLVEIIDNRVG